MDLTKYHVNEEICFYCKTGFLRSGCARILNIWMCMNCWKKLPDAERNKTDRLWGEWFDPGRF